jgi:geranylgeranyl reductase family protein
VRIRLAPTLDADVAIVGAGPAGAATATHLAAMGLEVLLLDRQSFPRDKVCGDFVGPGALRELEELGVADEPRFQETNLVRGAALFLDGEDLIARPLPEVDGLPAYGRVIPRLLLDHWLLEAARRAGTAILEGRHVTGLERHASGVTVTAESPDGPVSLRVRLVVAADGSNSTVARLLRGRPPPKRDRIIALRAYYEDVEGPADRADLYFTADSFPGYYWLFPTGAKEANVGIGMVQETVPQRDEHLRELLARLVNQDAALRSRLRGARLTGRVLGWPLTTYNPHSPLVDDRVMLVGDAAGLINPLNGEGIQYALLSGRWVAEAVQECALHDTFARASLLPYAQRVEKELGYDMALARLVVQLISNRAFNPLWLQVLRVIAARARVDAEYGDITGGVLAGVLPANRTMRPKVLGATAEQALRLVVPFGAAALRRPGVLTSLGLEAARTGFAAAYDTVRSPKDVLRWTARSGLDAIELATHVSRDVISSSARRLRD